MVIYVEVSLEGQYSNHLPPQVWNSVTQNKGKLELLAEDWTWNHKELKYIDVEAPEVIMERMLVSGIYRPKIMYKNIIRKGK